MRRTMLALAVAAATAMPAIPAFAAKTAHKSGNALVYRVDSVTAVVKGRKLTISAKGAVRSGGWENPHLVAKRQTRAEGDTLEVEFLATPPPPDTAVIQALLPVSATVTVRLPRYATTKVKVLAQSNAAEAQIAKTP